MSGLFRMLRLTAEICPGTFERFENPPEQGRNAFSKALKSGCGSLQALELADSPVLVGTGGLHPLGSSGSRQKLGTFAAKRPYPVVRAQIGSRRHLAASKTSGNPFRPTLNAVQTQQNYSGCLFTP